MGDNSTVNSIRIRLTDEINRWLFKKAEDEGITVSMILRDVLYREMEREGVKR